MLKGTEDGNIKSDILTRSALDADLSKEEVEILNKLLPTSNKQKSKEFAQDDNTSILILSSCIACSEDDNEEMIQCAECRAWIHYVCTRLPS